MFEVCGITEISKIEFCNLSSTKRVNGEEIFGTFYKKEPQKTIEKEFRVEKVIKRKVKNVMLNGKATMILLKIVLIKKISLYKMSYFPVPYSICKKKMKVLLGLSNYATENQQVFIKQILLKKLF